MQRPCDCSTSAGQQGTTRHPLQICFSHHCVSPQTYATKGTTSAFTRSACVQHRPCGPPAISANLTCLIILACRREVDRAFMCMLLSHVELHKMARRESIGRRYRRHLRIGSRSWKTQTRRDGLNSSVVALRATARMRPAAVAVNPIPKSHGRWSAA